MPGGLDITTMVVPQRTCIGCRQVKAKKDLIRIVRSPVGGIVTVDPRGKEKGRGAYICPNMDCINRAMQPEKLSKAFRITPSSIDRISPETIDKLRGNLLALVH
jgi:predicted RNA-binding protein YlxR (DUF448 family)